MDQRTKELVEILDILVNKCHVVYQYPSVEDERIHREALKKAQQAVIDNQPQPINCSTCKHLSPSSTDGGCYCMRLACVILLEPHKHSCGLHQERTLFNFTATPYISEQYHQQSMYVTAVAKSCVVCGKHFAGIEGDFEIVCSEECKYKKQLITN